MAAIARRSGDALGDASGGSGAAGAGTSAGAATAAVGPS
jgi:hypothetical protein